MVLLAEDVKHHDMSAGRFASSGDAHLLAAETLSRRRGEVVMFAFHPFFDTSAGWERGAEVSVLSAGGERTERQTSRPVIMETSINS